MISLETRNAIHQAVTTLLVTFLDKFDPETSAYAKLQAKAEGESGELKPFHQAILPSAVITASRFERSFSTTLGSMFEVTAEIIGAQHFSISKRGLVLVGGISATAHTAIEGIRNAIETQGMHERYPEYVNTVVGAFQGDPATRRVKVDLYLQDHTGNEFFFEMKSPKPNKDQCLGVTEKLLRIHAIRQDRSPRVQTYYAMAYNPYGSREAYSHSFSQRLLDMTNQVLLGSEFWDILGGPGTEHEVLNVFSSVGFANARKIHAVLGMN